MSDHGLDGFAGLCQRKLLSSHKRSGGVARSCPPTELEWRSNRKKARMALEARFPDGEFRFSVPLLDSFVRLVESAVMVNKNVRIWKLFRSSHFLGGNGANSGIEGN